MQSRICMPFLKIDLTSNSLWRKRVQMQPMRLCICSGTQFEETIKKRVQMQQMRLCVYSGRPFKKTSENYLRWKIVQMQSMRLCICLGRQFEKTFENTLWRKGVQMLPMWFCICSGRQFEEIIEKSLQMQQMRLCIFSRHFQKTSENSLVQMQSMQLCIWTAREFEDTYENSLLRKNLQMQLMCLCIKNLLISINTQNCVRAHMSNDIGRMVAVYHCCFCLQKLYQHELKVQWDGQRIDQWYSAISEKFIRPTVWF